MGVQRGGTTSRSWKRGPRVCGRAVLHLTAPPPLSNRTVHTVLRVMVNRVLCDRRTPYHRAPGLTRYGGYNLCSAYSNNLSDRVARVPITPCAIIELCIQGAIRRRLVANYYKTIRSRGRRAETCRAAARRGQEGQGRRRGEGREGSGVWRGAARDALTTRHGCP